MELSIAVNFTAVSPCLLDQFRLSHIFMKLVFSSTAWDDYLYWSTNNSKIHARINKLIKQCSRTPFAGVGKPEPLRGDLSDWWSRRISREDRMVYRVVVAGDAQCLEIAQLRFPTKRFIDEHASASFTHTPCLLNLQL